MDNPLKIIFCLPGSSFSGKFLECWSELLGYCVQKGIQFGVSRKSSPNIYYVRNMCLGADNLRGANQKPFNGKVDYTHLMWIDSDILFNPGQFQALLDRNVDIASGLYLMDGGKAFAAVKDWDEEYFKKNGSFQFLTPADFQNQTGLMEVSYAGFGFMLIKRGVFEALKYPWFRPIFKQIGPAVDFTMEDVGFCLQAQEIGYKIHIDPQVRVGHEKRIVY
jgi:hypothetical protein